MGWATLAIVLASATEPAPPASPDPFAGELALLGSVDLMPGQMMRRSTAAPSYGGEVLIPGVSLSGHAGICIDDRLALVGVAIGDFLFGKLQTSQLLALGVGLRLGQRHHMTLALAPGFWRSSGTVPGVDGGPRTAFVARGVLGTLRAHASLALIGRLSLALEAGLTFDGGVSTHFAAGLGGTW